MQFTTNHRFIRERFPMSTWQTAMTHFCGGVQSRNRWDVDGKQAGWFEPKIPMRICSLCYSHPITSSSWSLVFLLKTQTENCFLNHSTIISRPRGNKLAHTVMWWRRYPDDSQTVAGFQSNVWPWGQATTNHWPLSVFTHHTQSQTPADKQFVSSFTPIVSNRTEQSLCWLRLLHYSCFSNNNNVLKSRNHCMVMRRHAMLEPTQDASTFTHTHTNKGLSHGQSPKGWMRAWPTSAMLAARHTARTHMLVSHPNLIIHRCVDPSMRLTTYTRTQR